MKGKHFYAGGRQRVPWFPQSRSHRIGWKIKGNLLMNTQKKIYNNKLFFSGEIGTFLFRGTIPRGVTNIWNHLCVRGKGKN